MYNLFISFLTGIGALVSGLLAIATLFLIFRKLKKRRIPKGVVLTLDLDQGVIELPPASPAAKLKNKQPTLLQILDAIHLAAQDARVRSLFVRLGAAPIGMAQCQEIRDALIEFSRSGKPCVAFAPSLSNSNLGTRNYYLATACKEIYVQPSGDVGLCGMAARAFFLKPLLEKLGIKAQFEKRVEYKTAMNMLLEEGFTKEHRESLESISDSFVQQMISGVADAREIDRDEVEKIFAEGPHSAQEAVEKKLVDAALYEDEVYDLFRTEPEEVMKTMSLGTYFQKAHKPPKGKKSLGLIYGVGPVVDGDSGHSFLYRGSSMGDKTLTRAFRAAIKDESVGAIVFRVDSPGGSYVASDTIWREVCRAQDKGKAVIVTMGDVAGSGGYFVAMPAKHIIAQPGTITGSIGVLAGKLVTKEAWSRIGVQWEEVQTHENAGMWSDISEFTPEQSDKLKEMMDRIYADFTGRAAQGRGLSAEEIDLRARGRIFTGALAKELGLVDHLGGLKLALELGRKEAGIPEEKPCPIKVFPEEASFFEKISRKGGAQPTEIKLSALTQVEELKPFATALSLIGKTQRPGSLEMPHAHIWKEL